MKFPHCDSKAFKIVKNWFHIKIWMTEYFAKISTVCVPSLWNREKLRKEMKTTHLCFFKQLISSKWILLQVVRLWKSNFKEILFFVLKTCFCKVHENMKINQLILQQKSEILLDWQIFYFSQIFRIFHQITTALFVTMILFNTTLDCKSR